MFQVRQSVVNFMPVWQTRTIWQWLRFVEEQSFIFQIKYLRRCTFVLTMLRLEKNLSYYCPLFINKPHNVIHKNDMVFKYVKIINPFRKTWYSRRPSLAQKIYVSIFIFILKRNASFRLWRREGRESERTSVRTV